MANRIISYVRESRDEMRKVVWPTRREATRHTMLVIGLSLAVAVFLGLVDYFLRFLLERAIT